MSTWKEPVGPKAKGVYLRRRILVLVALVALAAAVVLIVLRPGSTGGAVGAREVEVPDDLVQVEQQDQQQAESDEPAPLAVCAAGQLVVTPVLDAASYGPEQLPLLSLSIENRSDAECSADLGTAGMSFTITSGSDQIWRSTDCQQNPDHRAVILKPGEPLETEPLAWDRTRSSPDTCDTEREAVVGGGASYHLRVSAAGVESNGTAQFQLY